MSRYNAQKSAKPYRAPSPFKPRVGPGLSRKADRDLYDACHLHWRAGLIESWYFGRRSPSDPTIVWELDGTEVDPSAIPGFLELGRDAQAVSGLAWGDWWCGYRAVIVDYADGSRAVESFDGFTVQVEEGVA